MSSMGLQCLAFTEPSPHSVALSVTYLQQLPASEHPKLPVQFQMWNSQGTVGFDLV